MTNGKHRFARRSEWARETNRLTSQVKELTARGVDVLDLTISNPTRCGFSYPPEWLNDLADKSNFSYNPDPQGQLSARQAVSDYYARQGVVLDPKNIFLTASTSEAYAFLFRLLADPNDNILLPHPSYPLFHFLAGLNDLEERFYSLRDTDGWAMDLKEAEQFVDSATKIFLCVNPNNPTGSYVAGEEVAVLNSFCVRHNLAVISDEVFHEYALEAESRPASLTGQLDVLTFVLGGLSKSLALPQMKLSWIILSGPADEVESARAKLEIIADTYLSVNTPIQNAIGHWLPETARIQGAIRARIKRNYQNLISQCKTVSSVDCLKTEGGWYAVLRIPAVRTEEEWVLEFLNEDHVFVHPGYFFDFEKEAYLVLCLLPEEHIFEMGVGRILKRIQLLCPDPSVCQ